MIDRETFRQVLGEVGTTVAYTDEADATCPGGQALNVCEQTAGMLDEAAEWPSPQRDGFNGWNVLAWIGQQCRACERHCEIGVEVVDGTLSGLMRVMFTEEDPSIMTVHVDTASYTRRTEAPGF
jgi:hypothetical protein